MCQTILFEEFPKQSMSAAEFFEGFKELQEGEGKVRPPSFPSTYLAVCN